MIALLLLAAALPLMGQTVEGRIVNASTGAGVAGATVIVENGEQPQRITTDAEGRFHLDDLAAGTYSVFYRARGYWSDPFLQNRERQPHFQVTAGGAPVHLEYQLKPLPKIAGRVVDGNRRPVPKAHIRVIGSSSHCNDLPCYPVMKQAEAGEQGEFQIDDVDDPEMQWVLAAAAPASFPPPQSPEDRPLGWTQTFYPDVTDIQLAAKVVARPGTEQWNLDIRLASAPVHRVRGRVLDPGGEPVANTIATLYNGFGSTYEQTTRKDGSFEFASVPEGDWRVWAKLEQGNGKLWAAQSLQVKGRDSIEAELRLSAGFTLHGKLVWDAPEGVAAPSRSPNTVFVYDTGMFGQDQTAGFAIGHPGERSEFAVQVYPGPYHMFVLDSPSDSPYYLESIRLGSADALTSGSIPILSGAQPVVVTYKFGGGTVQGTIDSCGAGRVLLVPADEQLRRPGLVRDTGCGSNGQFTFHAVRPGEYLGFAIAGDDFPTTGLDAMVSRAARITVRNNEHTTAEIKMVR